jgi:hypothetical protein
MPSGANASIIVTDHSMERKEASRSGDQGRPEGKIESLMGESAVIMTVRLGFQLKMLAVASCHSFPGDLRWVL